jgi:pimeloyl-ACP methyl ester carboxylesterase
VDSIEPAAPALAGPSRLRAARALGRLVALAVLAYGAAMGGLYHWQESLLFRPTPLPADHRFDLPDVVERSIEVDGATLSALHLRLPAPSGVVFFLHGNAGNLATWFTGAAFYRRVNYDLVMIDYRGYGKSTGRIESEDQLRADVRAAWDAIAPEYAGKRRVIYGRSLGTGLAAMLSADVAPDLTVLVSPYCRMTDLARLHYPWIPSTLLRYPLATCDAIARVNSPVLLVHGERDTVIPVEHSEHLLARAPRAELLRIPEAGHADVQRFDVYLRVLAERLARL